MNYTVWAPFCTSLVSSTGESCKVGKHWDIIIIINIMYSIPYDNNIWSDDVDDDEEADDDNDNVDTFWWWAQDIVTWVKGNCLMGKILSLP